jgi:hypothetical protein
VEFVLSKGQNALKIALTGTFLKKIPLYHPSITRKTKLNTFLAVLYIR